MKGKFQRHLAEQLTPTEHKYESNISRLRLWLQSWKNHIHLNEELYVQQVKTLQVLGYLKKA